MKHVLIKSNAAKDISNLPEYIRNVPPISDDPAALAVQGITTGAASINGFVSKAVLAMAKGADSEICVIQMGVGTYASEWKKEDGTYIVAYCNSKGELNATRIRNKRYMTLDPVGNPSDSEDTTSILAMYIAMICENTTTAEGADAAGAMERCRKEYGNNKKIPINDLFKLNDYIINMLDKSLIKTNITNGDIEMLTKARVEAGGCSGEIICGKSDILMPGSTMTVSSGISIAEAKAMFKDYADSRTWTAEEKERIRTFDDTDMVPEEIIDMAEWFISQRDSKLPSNNMCWRGITGCGKSTGVAMLSCILNTPLYIMTCSTNMETSDFLSQLVPTNRAESLNANISNIGLSDIIGDPEYAYEQITGTHKDGVTADQAFAEYTKACAEASGKGTYFKRVESEYIKALQTGAIVEIQEFSRIRDSGVLVGLNEYDHAKALIPLVDGSYTTRHPDAIVIWTDNIGYGSCRPVDPSVLRRMSLIFDTFDLDKGMVVGRAMSNTGNVLSKEVVNAMYEVWAAIREYCAKEDITEGELSPCDFENWVARCAVKGLSNAYATCRQCMIAKLTTDRETQDAIYNGVAVPIIDKWIGPFNV